MQQVQTRHTIIHSYTPMITKMGECPTSSLVNKINGQLKKMWYIQTMRYYSATEVDEVWWMYVTAWTNLRHTLYDSLFVKSSTYMQTKQINVFLWTQEKCLVICTKFAFLRWWQCCRMVCKGVNIPYQRSLHLILQIGDFVVHEFSQQLFQWTFKKTRSI